MNIRRIKYQMEKDGEWKIGYVIGEYDGQLKTLLDENLNYVPKIVEGEREFTLYDLREDLNKQLNITLSI